MVRSSVNKQPLLVDDRGEIVEQRFPLFTSKCPAYWTEESDGTCKPPPNQINGPAKCDSSSLFEDSRGSYTDNPEGPQTVNFGDMSWPERCKWANMCGVYWESVSDKPCISSAFMNTKDFV